MAIKVGDNLLHCFDKHFSHGIVLRQFIEGNKRGLWVVRFCGEEEEEEVISRESVNRFREAYKERTKDAKS